MNKAELMAAVTAVLDGDWDASHKTAQNYSDTTANWLHAVLHKKAMNGIVSIGTRARQVKPMKILQMRCKS